jgi:TonB family protein
MTVDKLPEVTHRVAPDYPAQLARQGIEGTVVLDCLLSDSGTVDSVAVVKGIHPLLDSSAAAALRSFRFSPALSGGKPVPVLVQYALPFSLSEIAAGIPQYVTIQGTLKESGTRTPIPNAMVVAAFPDSTADTGLSIPFSRYLAAIGAFGNQRFEAGKLVTTTDSLGKFRFLSLPACSVVITSPLPGYESISERELIRKGEALTLTYYSQRMSYNNFEIVVYGKTEEKEVARHQLTLAETRKIPGLGNDAVRVIQAMPGVSRPSFGSGDIIVRGQPNWDSKFFLDGTEIPLIYHFGGLKSIYNPDALKSVDFYPGGWGCRYGGATAGIIEIKGRPAKSDRWHGQLDLNLIDGACFAEGPLMKNISMLVSARRGFLGDFASWYFKKYPDQFPFSLAPYYSDILVRGDISLSKNNTCFVTLLHNRDSLGIFVPSVQGGSSEIGGSTNALGVSIRFTTGQIGLSTRISPKLSNELRYALTVYGYTQTMFGFASADQRSYLHHFRDDMTYAPNEWMQLSAGTDINLMLLDLALEITSGKGIVNRDTTNNWLFGVVGAYVQLTIKPTDALELSPGLRYDYFPELIHHGAIVPEFWNYHWINNHQGPSAEPSLRISGRYRLRENHTVKAAVGNYSQTPQPMGQVIHKTWGDPSLPTTKAAQCIAGYECRLTDLINADLQCYYNRQWDIPREATPEDLAKNPDALWLRDGKGRMRGLELMLRHENNGRFFGWLSYTLARSERWNHKEKKYSLFSDDETHNIQLMASRHLKHEWDVGCRVRYVTGKPTTPVIDVVENEPYNYFEPIYGAENSTRMDPFFQIDVRIDKKFVYRTWMLSLYCDVQNLSWLFYKSPEMVVWNYDYTAKQNVSNIIQPALGFKAEF